MVESLIGRSRHGLHDGDYFVRPKPARRSNIPAYGPRYEFHVVRILPGQRIPSLLSQRIAGSPRETIAHPRVVLGHDENSGDIGMSLGNRSESGQNFFFSRFRCSAIFQERGYDLGLRYEIN
jgi:hypothetical protein